MFTSLKKHSNIRRVIPTGDWKLIIEFDNQEFKSLDYNDLGSKYSFCAFPNQLKAFSFTEKDIVWKNGVKLKLNSIHSVSKSIDKKQLINSYLRINMKNQAPTSEDEKHHVYEVSIRPFDSTRLFSLSESIHGGFGDRGGSRSCSTAQLLDTLNWQSHFELSDCKWAIPIIEENYNNEQVMVDLIVEGIRTRSNFN